MPTRKKRRHRKRKTYKRGGRILKSVQTTQPDGYIGSTIMPSTNNNGLLDKDKFVPSVKSPWLPRLNEAKYANNMLFGKKGEVKQKAMFIVLNNEMEKQQADLYNDIVLEAARARARAGAAAEAAYKAAEAAYKAAAGKAAYKAANAAYKAAYKAAEAAGKEAAEAAGEANETAAEAAYRAATEAYNNSFNTFLSKYFPNPGLPPAVGPPAPAVGATAVGATAVGATAPAVGPPAPAAAATAVGATAPAAAATAVGATAAPAAEKVEELIKKETLWPKDQNYINNTYIHGVFLDILKKVSIEEEKERKKEGKEKEEEKEKETKEEEIRKLRKLIYKHRTRFYTLIDDKMVETFMDKVGNTNTKYSSIYKKGDTTTYDNIRYVIMWILFKIDTEL